MNFFVVIDAQEDFARGTLANENFVKVIPTIKQELENARKRGDTIIFTKDTHYQDYLTTSEGKHLPVEHCIKDTDGWQIVKELEVQENDLVIQKDHFGFNLWEEYIQEGDTITVCGTVTEICVVSNCLAFKQIEGVEVNVIANACAGLTEEGHKAAITVMKNCQCNIIGE